MHPHTLPYSAVYGIVKLATLLQTPMASQAQSTGPVGLSPVPGSFGEAEGPSEPGTT